MSGIELGTVCTCVYKLYVDEPVTVISIVFNFLLSSLLVVIGLKVNLKFREKLQKEKRNTPLGRKGNVIEPIMRWYLNLTIIHWPYVIGFMWLNTNEMLPAAWFSNCWIMNLLMQPMRIGRSIIAYNSFFVAFIRYLYIVHRETANEWDFEKVGKRFQYASIGVPIILELLRVLTESRSPDTSCPPPHTSGHCWARAISEKQYLVFLGRSCVGTLSSHPATRDKTC